MNGSPVITAFFDEATNTISYLVADPATHFAAVIDPVLDFDPPSGEANACSARKIIDAARDRGWQLAMVLETHAHADHISAAAFIRAGTGAWIGIGEHIREVQQVFRPIFAMGDFEADGSDFDCLFKDGERFALGSLEVEVMHVPGHTPADVAYRIGDTLFVGDTLFMPDSGTARADFPGGDARTLYRSIRRLLSLPDDTRLFLCHDYKSAGRIDHRWETTVGDERRHNIHVRDGVSEDAFVARREARDKSLTAPRLLLPSIQVNIRAGSCLNPRPTACAILKFPFGLEAASQR